MSQLVEQLTCRDCYSCPQYKPSKYTFALNQTTTNYLEFVFQLMLLLILIITYYTAVRQIKLTHQHLYLIYYFVVLLIQISHISYSIIGWLLHYSQSTLYFNQKIHFYLVDQGDILLTSFFLLIASKKIQDFGNNINIGLTVWILQLQNIFYTLANSVWLIIVVFYYNLCSGQIEFYQSSELNTRFICILTIGLIYSFQIRQQIVSLKTQIPLILLYIIFIVSLLLNIIQFFLKYNKQLWLINYKYGHQWNEISSNFDQIVYYKFQNTPKYSIQVLIIYLFTVCLPLLVFIRMYSKVRNERNQRNERNDRNQIDAEHILNIN